MLKKISIYFKDKSPYSIRILVYIIGLILISILVINLRFSSIDAFWGALAGGFIGFIGSLLLKDLSLYIEERAKLRTRKENTKFIYEMYKMELEQNIDHLKHMINNKGIPYYRLKTITRNNLWGKLADYSKDLDLFKKINFIYQEFELINNKIDIMNIVKTKDLVARYRDEKESLGNEMKGQLDGAITLAEKVIPLTQECINILNKMISQI